MTPSLLDLLRNELFGSLLIAGVADAERVVGQNDVRIEHERRREGQPSILLSGVMQDATVDEIFHVAEREDFGNPRLQPGRFHAEQRSQDMKILTTSKLTAKGRAQRVQQDAQPLSPDIAAGRKGDAGQDVEERALACAVRTDDADPLAGLDDGIDPAQGPAVASRLDLLSRGFVVLEQFGIIVVHITRERDAKRTSSTD